MNSGDKTLGCVCVRYGTDDEVNHSETRIPSISEQNDSQVEEGFGRERLENVQAYMLVTRAE